MIGTFRRHQNWLWMVIIVATIVSFVWYFNPSNRNNAQGPDTSGNHLGSINGDPITPDQLQAAEREGRIFFRVNYGEWPDSQEKQKDVRRFAEQRLLLNAELEQYHITPTDEAAARFIKQLLGIKPTDNVPADKITETLNKLVQDGGVTMDDLARFARHQVGQEYLVALVGMTGRLITTNEVATFYRRENEPIETELVTVPMTNFYPMIKPTEKDIEEFYTKQQADYRVPDRIEVNYVAFSASNYTANAMKQLGTNFDQQVEQDYLRAGPAAFKDEAGAQMTPEAAKAKIRSQIILYATLTEARKAANDFVTALAEGHDETHPYAANDLFTVAKAKNVPVKSTAPFDMKNPPKEMLVPVKSLRALFSLRDDDPDDKDHSLLYAPSPLVGENAVYVVGLKKRIPSEIEPLATVHDKVMTDYRNSKALELAKAAGTRFQQALTDGVSQGKTFDTMCAAQFIRPQKLPPFSLTTSSIPEMPDKAEFQQLQEIAGRMLPGQYSPFIPAPDGGLLLYVKARLPADETALNRDLPAYLARMRQQFQIAAFNAWFNKEAQQRLVLPPSEMNGSGG